jgi:hypothetical protein
MKLNYEQSVELLKKGRVVALVWMEPQPVGAYIQHKDDVDFQGRQTFFFWSIAEGGTTLSYPDGVVGDLAKVRIHWFARLRFSIFKPPVFISDIRIGLSKLGGYAWLIELRRVA